MQRQAALEEKAKLKKYMLMVGGSQMERIGAEVEKRSQECGRHTE